MKENKLTQNDVAKLLKEKVNIDLKSATISRYNKNGLILMPKRFPNYFNGVSRIYYHPSVPVELASAFLLFRGDWLKLDSKYRLSRYSTQDIFIGRLLFYLRQYRKNFSHIAADIPIDFSEFNTSTDLFVTENGIRAISMDADSIEAYIASYKKKFLQPFKFFQIEDSYLQFAENIYRVTFLQLHKVIYGYDSRMEGQLLEFASTHTDPPSSPF